MQNHDQCNSEQLRATDVHARTTTECEDRARSNIIKSFLWLRARLLKRNTGKARWRDIFKRLLPIMLVGRWLQGVGWGHGSGLQLPRAVSGRIGWVHLLAGSVHWWVDVSKAGGEDVSANMSKGGLVWWEACVSLPSFFYGGREKTENPFLADRDLLPLNKHTPAHPIMSLDYNGKLAPPNVFINVI